MFLYEKFRVTLSGVYIFYAAVYSRLVSLLRIKQNGNKHRKNIKKSFRAARRKMQNFVLTGKAKTVFRLIELKAKQEAMAKRGKKQDSRNKK
jgi:hypothetical protein